MKKQISTLWMGLVLMGLASNVAAHRHDPICIDAAGQRYCTKNPRATITQDALGNVVCGLGQCMADALGNQICSNQPGGRVRSDAMGNVSCKGECVPAAEQYCNLIPEGQVEESFSEEDKN